MLHVNGREVLRKEGIELIESLLTAHSTPAEVERNWRPWRQIFKKSRPAPAPPKASAARLRWSGRREMKPRVPISRSNSHIVWLDARSSGPSVQFVGLSPLYSQPRPPSLT